MAADPVDFLKRHGAQESGHTDRSLLEHLRGTQALLEQWGASPAVCAAGLFHSVYGTESYKHVTLPTALRGHVQAIIGVESEALAYLFGCMSYPSFGANGTRHTGFSVVDRFTGAPLDLEEAVFTALCELMVANVVEQAPGVPPERMVSFCERYGWLHHWVSEAAREALTDGERVARAECAAQG